MGRDERIGHAGKLVQLVLGAHVLDHVADQYHQGKIVGVVDRFQFISQR